MGHLIDVAARGQLLLRPPGGPPRRLSLDSARWRESSAGSLLNVDPDVRVALIARIEGGFSLLLAAEDHDGTVYSERRLTLAEAFALLPETGRRWAERKVREAARSLSERALSPPHSGVGPARTWTDAHRICRAAGLMTDLAAVLDGDRAPSSRNGA